MRKLLELPGKGKRRKTVSRKYFSRLEFNYGLSRFGVGKRQAPDPVHFAIMLAPRCRIFLANFTPTYPQSFESNPLTTPLS